MSINDKDGAGDLLHCPVCRNSFEPPPRNSGGDVRIDLSFSHVPKILAGCLHTICQSCAEEALQRSDVPSTIPCPVCRLVTTGVLSTDGLTNNILVLQEVQRRSKQCDYCDDVVDATHRCIECKSLLCSFHVKSHARSRGTKAHNIFLLRGSNRGVGAAAATGVVRRLPLACPRHAGAPAKLFCSEPCGALLCHDCSVADHSGHTIFLADSEEVEVIHRTGLTRRVIDLGHRLAEVQGAVEAVEAVKTGVEQSTKMAEKAAAQAFSNLRRAIDFREKAMLKNLRGARISNTRDLNAQLAALEQLARAYTAAMETTGVCLKNLKGDQLLAMEPDLRKCMDKHEADFQSLTLDPCVDDHVEFAHDRDVGNALRLGISKYGCLTSVVAGLRDKKEQPPEAVVSSATQDVHFTLAAVAGPSKKKATANPSDIVVVEMRSGSEQDFFKNGIEGPLVGRVVLHTRLQGTKYLTYESEHFLESLSHQVLSDKPQSFSDGVPTVRFTKTLRVSGRNGERPNLRR